MQINFDKIKTLMWDRYYIVGAFLLFIAVVFISFSKPWNFNDDIWETGAAINEISLHPLHPTNPLLLLPGNTSPRFVPYTVFWGIVKKVLGLNIFTMLGIISIINYIIFIRGLYLFVSIKFKDKLLPVYTLIVMMVFWGTGFGWANEYNLGAFLQSQALTGYFAFALGLNALYYLIRYLEQGNNSCLTAYFIISIVIFISHPITSIFIFILAFSIILESNNFNQLIFLQLIPITAFALSLLWPYFSYWKIFTNGTSGKWFITPVFSNQINALGFALIGIIIIILYYIKKLYKFLFYSLLLCFALYTISYFLKIDIGGRFIIFSVFIMHIGISIYIKQTNLFSYDTIKLSFKNQSAKIIIIFLLLLYPIRLRIIEIESYAKNFFDLPFKIHSYNSPIKPYLFLTNYISSSNVVIVDEGTGHLAFNKPAWPIPMLTGAKIVALEHYDPLILQESISRAEDVHKFFRENLTLNERTQILLKYKTTDILIDEKYEKLFDSSFSRQLDSLGTLIIKEYSIKLYKTNRIL